MSLGADTFHWDVLLASIEEGRIVPVVGPELLVYSDNGGHRSLESLLAERLQTQLQIEADAVSPELTLRGLASRYLEHGGHRGMLYSAVHTVLAEADLEPPEPLLQLARVRGLKLFVSTTFDSCLQRALDTVRFDGEPRTASRVYSLRKKVEDLPRELERLEQPLVFHMFGRSSTAADFVLTDEDLLEFVHTLHTSDRRPQLLFDALRDYNLLVIGCSFPDWLTRFFVRVLSDMRLLDPRGTLETIADDRTASNPELVAFLNQCKVSVYRDGGTLDFVEELCRRWQERHPAEADAADSPAAVVEPPDLPPGGIFLSYASEDRDAVLELKRGLEDAGIEVWFDQRRLEAGDLYERKIRRNIEACSYFLPVISAASRQRLEGYYRKEWYWAIERSKRFHKSYPFIQPIVVDDTAYDADGIPDEFANRHWQVFRGGTPSTEFVDLTRQRLRELRKRQAGRL